MGKNGLFINEINDWYYESSESNNGNVYRAISSHIENVVPFIGAGFSIWAKFPGWKDLTQKFIDQSGITEKIDDNTDFSGVAQRIINEKGSSFLFNIIEEEYKTEKIQEEKRPEYHGQFIKLFKNSSIITTNYDESIECLYRRYNKGSQISVVDPNNVDGNTSIRDKLKCLYKVHGTVNESASIILTTKSYDEAYGKPLVDLSKPMPSALRTLMESNYVLFIGCSLSKDRMMEIIRRCAGKDAFYAILRLPKNIGRYDKRAEREYDPIVLKEFNRRKEELNEMGITPLWIPTDMKYDDCLLKIFNNLCLEHVVEENNDEIQIGASSNDTKFAKPIVDVKLDEVLKLIKRLDEKIDNHIERQHIFNDEVIKKLGITESDGTSITIVNQDYRDLFEEIKYMVDNGIDLNTEKSKQKIKSMCSLLRDEVHTYSSEIRLKYQSIKEFLIKNIDDDVLLSSIYLSYGVNERLLGLYGESINSIDKSISLGGAVIE